MLEYQYLSRAVTTLFYSLLDHDNADTVSSIIDHPRVPGTKLKITIETLKKEVKEKIDE